MTNVNNIEILSITRVSKLTTLSRSTIYRLIKAGDFPAPINLSSNRSGFRFCEIEVWVNSRNTTNNTNNITQELNHD